MTNFRKLQNEELNRISTEAFKKAPKLPVVILLDHVRSQNNVGSVFRTSDAFRIEAMPAEALADGLRAAYAAHKTAFGFFDGRESCLLTLKDAAVMDALLPTLSPASRRLDVTVLHTLILERLLGIDKKNMANGTNLTYTRAAAEAVSAVRSGSADACFLLNPTRVEEIRDVAAAGEKMPQKSTYFYPKLITGLTVNPLF